MKLTKKQLQQLEEVLVERGWRKWNNHSKNCGIFHNEDYSWGKRVVDEEPDEYDETRYRVGVHIGVWDWTGIDPRFTKEMGEFLIGADINVMVNDNTQPTDFYYRSFADDQTNSIFCRYVVDDPEKQYLYPIDPTKEQINALVEKIERLGVLSSDFYKTIREEYK